MLIELPVRREATHDLLGSGRIHENLVERGREVMFYLGPVAFGFSLRADEVVEPVCRVLEARVDRHLISRVYVRGRQIDSELCLLVNATNEALLSQWRDFTPRRFWSVGSIDHARDAFEMLPFQMDRRIIDAFYGTPRFTSQVAADEARPFTAETLRRAVETLRRFEREPAPRAARAWTDAYLGEFDVGAERRRVAQESRAAVALAEARPRFTERRELDVSRSAGGAAFPEEATKNDLKQVMAPGTPEEKVHRLVRMTLEHEHDLWADTYQVAFP